MEHPDKVGWYWFQGHLGLDKISQPMLVETGPAGMVAGFLRGGVAEHATIGCFYGKWFPLTEEKVCQ